MRIFKNKAFSKWAAKENVSDDALRIALNEIERGLIDADLGGHVLKKRVAVAVAVKGKSGGVRTLLVYRFKGKAFFVYGFAKSKQANIKDDELKALKLYAKVLLSYSDKELNKADKAGVLIEVKSDG